MSNINDFVRPTSTTDRRDINKILELIHDLVAAPVEDEGAQERITHASHLKTRTTTVTTGGATRIGSNFRDRENFVLRRKPPTVVKSYPLIHTSLGSGAFTFPGKDTKFGARCDTDGNRRIRITDQSILNPTTAFACAFWIFPQFGGALDHSIIDKAVQYRVIIDKTTNTLRCIIKIGGVLEEVDFILPTTATWYHVTFMWDNTSNLLELYVDGVQRDTEITSGNADTTTNNLAIFATDDGSNPAPANTRLALLSLLNKKVSSVWITNHFNGLLDTSDGNDEILTINFVGDENPTPDELTNFCKSS